VTSFVDLVEDVLNLKHAGSGDEFRMATPALCEHSASDTMTMCTQKSIGPEIYITKLLFEMRSKEHLKEAVIAGHANLKLVIFARFCPKHAMEFAKPRSIPGSYEKEPVFGPEAPGHLVNFAHVCDDKLALEGSGFDSHICI
jgi:hypothetical protein